MGLLITVLLALFFLGGGAPWSQEDDKEPIRPPARHKPADEEGGPGFPEELKPTAEQKKKLKELHFKFEEKRHDIILKVQNKKSELALLLNEENPDRKKIEKKLKEIMALENRLQSLMLDEFFEVRKILKPGQRKLFTRRLIRVILK
jgi:Spy/CpxP family protein refolding chaperone